LVEIAAGLPGCHGARLTGAGFGGCTVNLVTAKEAPAFCERLAAVYSQVTGKEASVWITRASEGAGVVSLLPD
jgi:galactokinase